MRILPVSLTAAIAAAALAPSAAATLPASLSPPSPFPAVVAQNSESEFVAPGVRRGRYQLSTAAGPLTIEVVAVDTNVPTVRIGAVLAQDHLISPGETVSSMAIRTHAVAGVNGDYFDIGQTNQPLNIVVKDGALVRTPSQRIAIDVDRDRTVHFDTFQFSASVQYDGVQIPLTGVNEFPPQGGASLLTSAFGTLPPASGVSLFTLEPVGPLASVQGSSRVTSASISLVGAVTDPTLAFGPAALGFGPPPAVGDVVQIVTKSDPPLEEIANAVGGGPLLLVDGKPFDDPNAPAPEERNRRFPLSGAALTADGTLLLIAVDGRQPSLSVGLTRPEFAALMRGLGATDGMAFDSGGSATLVARILGEPQPRVLNAPSDGLERPVADGLFVYSDAPTGPPARLVVRPERIVAVPGATLAIGATRTDEAGHYVGASPIRLDPSPLAHLDAHGALHVASAPGSGTLVAHDGSLKTEIPIAIVGKIARLTIEPAEPNPNPGDLVQLDARAADATGRTVFTGSAVAWGADRGQFVQPGLYRAANGDATITARVMGLTATTSVRVGRHDQPMAWFGPQAAGRWHFEAAPRDGPGAAALEPGALRLDYDFTGSERAAYAAGSFPIQGEPLGISIEIEGDASGVGLRAAFLNRFGERSAVTLAKTVDWRGPQRRTVMLPGELNPPVTLVALYAVPSLGTPPVRSAGTIRFRNPIAVMPGMGGALR